MAFLDNSGDIILDAVLTDTGRHRLAKGDGSFRITKFALGDDEINYGLYDKNNPSGSAYYDLSILQTPVLEAFTNNTSLMKSKLISVPRTNLLYLPILLQNTIPIETQTFATDYYVVCVDNDTEQKASQQTAGVLFGESPTACSNQIRVDQGLNTGEISPSFPLDADLVETQYIVELDNRLAQLYAPTQGGAGTAKVSFIDDDQVASYYLSFNTDSAYVNQPVGVTAAANDASNTWAIAGPRGTAIQFKLKASIDLNSSTFLFEQLGDIITGADLNLGPETLPGDQFRFIDSMVRVSGATTGYRIDLPIRFVKVI